MEGQNVEQPKAGRYGHVDANPGPKQGLESRKDREPRGGPRLPIFRLTTDAQDAPVQGEIDAGGLETAVPPTQPRRKQAARDSEKRPRRYSDDYLCTEAFRETVLREYPILREQDSHRWLFGHILFSANKAGYGSWTLTPAPLLARFEGKERQEQSGHYVAREFLERFKQDVLPDFRWFSYFGGEYCRSVEADGMREDILRARDEDLRVSAAGGLVYFASGLVFNDKAAKKVREEVRAEAAGRSHLALCETTARAVKYMNGRTSHVFSKVLSHLDAAYHAVDTCPDLDTHKKRTTALQTLRKIRENPQPFYQASTNNRSVRIFSLGPSLLTIKSEIRKVLTKGWTDYDLKSAQLAICAALWGVPEVMDFLRQDGSIWTELITTLGFDTAHVERDVLKKVLKPSLYSVMYGMGMKNLKKEFIERYAEMTAKHPHYHVDDPFDRFINHPLIAAMYKARNAQLSRIRWDEGARDCFGNWIEYKRNDNGSDRSILAQVAQSWELFLLEPVLDLAERTKDFQITLWQHDGCSINYTRKQHLWEPRIMDSVQERADRLGIPTMLETSTS